MMEKLTWMLTGLAFGAELLVAQCLPKDTILVPPTSSSYTGYGVALSTYVPGPTGNCSTIQATDLSGNVLWQYTVPRAPYLTRVASPTTVLAITEGAGATVPYGDVREINTSGKVVRLLTVSQINSQLTARGLQPVLDFNHDAIRLPNGYTAVIAHNEMMVSCSQYPKQCPGGGKQVDILGDAIVVLDTNWKVSWVWNAFNWLPLSRAALLGEKCIQNPPLHYCDITLATVANDWLHSNSLYYDPTDGNLVLSIRHQDWVIKIAYQNGEGDGHVLWTLGDTSDLNFAGNTFTMFDPRGVTWPWFSHQHDVGFSKPVPGRPKLLTVFDNGNTRVAPPPIGTGSGNSRGQAWIIDERNMTATLTHSFDLGVYSEAYGSAQQLPNGNFWFFAGLASAPLTFYARQYEITPTGQLAYEAIENSTGYRSLRMSGLFTY